VYVHWSSGTLTQTEVCVCVCVCVCVWNKDQLPLKTLFHRKFTFSMWSFGLNSFIPSLGLQVINLSQAACELWLLNPYLYWQLTHRSLNLCFIGLVGTNIPTKFNTLAELSHMDHFMLINLFW